MKLPISAHPSHPEEDLAPQSCPGKRGNTSHRITRGFECWSFQVNDTTYFAHRSLFRTLASWVYFALHGWKRAKPVSHLDATDRAWFKSITTTREESGQVIRMRSIHLFGICVTCWENITPSKARVFGAEKKSGLEFYAGEPTYRDVQKPWVGGPPSPPPPRFSEPSLITEGGNLPAFSGVGVFAAAFYLGAATTVFLFWVFASCQS